MTDTVVVKSGTPPADEPLLKLSRQPAYHDLMALARTLLETGFLPQAIKTPGQALAIILTGQEMKLGPMQSLRSIGIINGKPVLAADLQLALFHRDGGLSKWETLTDEEAVLWLKHPNGVEHTQTFTMDMAAQAELDKNPGRTYQKFPQAMLRSRAITWGLKAIGFEPVTGVYDPDELVALPSAAQLRELPEMAVERGGPVSKPPGAIRAPLTGPVEPIWPFGTKRGTPLAELSTEDLRAALAWIRKTHKGEELVQPNVDLLAQRMADQPEPAA